MERSPRSSVDGAEHVFVSESEKCRPPLDEAVLHVWTFSQEVNLLDLSRQEHTLSDEEWRRVRRYSSARPARRFIVRRGLLRRILGKYLGRSPEEVRFVYNAHGKPILSPELFSDLQFSLSHSGEMAALAVGVRDPLGIDIERLRTFRVLGGTDFLESPTQEAVRFTRSAASKGSLGFIQAWTRREAVAKAEGRGLQMLPGRYEVDGMTYFMQPYSTSDGSLYRRGFHVHTLTLPAGYVGVLAARQKTPKIVYFSL